MCDIVNDLLTKIPFAELPYEDKLQIVQTGRPQPSLPELKSESADKNKVYTRTFNAIHYEKHPWLTGSSTSNKLYCWACLLFSTEIGPWNKTGFSSLNHLVAAFAKHQKSMSHLLAFSTLQTYGTQIIDDSMNLQKKIADNLHNKKVKENRIILRRLIDTVTFLVKQEYAFRGHNEAGDSTNKGMYTELLEFLARYDQTLANHLKTSTVFRGTSLVIQNDLIDAMAGVITDKIKSEISNATFVAIKLDETTDVTNKSQLSTIIRFVDNEGNCQERFLQFTDVSLDRTAQGLFKHVTKIVDDLDCSKKLVAQTFDGAAVMAGPVSGLQALVKNKYPSATFIHCYSHRLNLVLAKSTDCITECRQFFITLSGITIFFSHSTVRLTALKNFVEEKRGAVIPVRWDFSSRLVNTVKENREHLIEFFLSIQDEPGDWTGEEVNAALGFVCFLCKFNTRFLLPIFDKIFTFSAVLFGILQKKCMDISFCTKKVNEFCDALEKIRDEDFDRIWLEATIKSEDEDTEYESRPKRQKLDDRSKYQRIFNEILDTLMLQIKFRFESQKDLKFVSLLDSSKFNRFCVSFPYNFFAELTEPYASNFDIGRLKNELRVFYTLDEYKKKSVTEITNYMKLHNLDVVFSEVYKLAELVLTFPSITLDRSSSALKRIKTYLKGTQGQVQLSNLAVISIEKNILLDMEKWSEEAFYEKVTRKFTLKERGIEFLFK